MLHEGESSSGGTARGISGFRFDGFHITKQSLVTVIVCTGLSMLFMRTGLLTLLYLVPLGYSAIAGGSFLFTFFAAASVNLVINVIVNFSSSGNADMWLNIFYLTALIFMFTWIAGGKKTRTAYRIIISSCAAAIIFLLMVNRIDDLFFTFSMEIAEEILPGLVTAEMLETAKSILYRGGALVSMIFLFFINRHIAVSIVWLIKRQKSDRGLKTFYAPSEAIWVFSGSLATILLAGLFGIEIFEIIAWNVFVVCVIIFMTQGFGILQHLLAKRSPAFRTGSIILLVILFFSPMIVITVLALLVLGIIEIWRPLRRAVS